MGIRSSMGDQVSQKCVLVSWKCFLVSWKCFLVSWKGFLVSWFWDQEIFLGNLVTHWTHTFNHIMFPGFMVSGNQKHFSETGKHFSETRKHIWETKRHFWETETHFWETGTPFLGNLGLLLELLIRFIIKRFIDFGKLGLTICPRVNIHHRKKIKNLILHGVTPLMGFLMVHYVGDIGPEWGETGGALRWGGAKFQYNNPFIGHCELHQSDYSFVTAYSMYNSVPDYINMAPHLKS